MSEIFEVPADLTPSRAVKVVIPVKVAFDIEALFNVQRQLFDRLGHGGCYSGTNFAFEVERSFVADVNGALRSVGEV
jgi:hypothetical protein